MDYKDICEQAYKKGVRDTLLKLEEMFENEKTKFAEDFYIIYMIDVERIVRELWEKAQ